MGEGYKIMIVMWLPMLIVVVAGMKYIHYSEKVVRENRRKKGVPVEWK